jgi:glycosyltransferase involved in cell wall biosynthesis
MTGRKPRILFVGEASWLSTGFATYNREILRRLHATGKYEIAEMGAYGSNMDHQAQALPWRFFGTLPTNEREQEIYQRDRRNEFGGYKAEGVLVEFQPDIVFDARDPWMFDFLVQNRFRKNYKLILTPTVDSEPQRRDWVDDLFKKADAVCTYSRFGKRVLEVEKIPVAEVLSPGVDLEVFKPLDKAEIRKEWCLNKDLFVIGTVMRNQKRKLFPDLFQAFELLRARHRNDPDIQKTVLLCHTSFPDVGWDLPELLYRSALQRHVIFTYKCDNCNNTFLSWFIPGDSKGHGRCVKCGENAAHMPTTHKGYSVDDLAQIYNLMDVYVQTSICEGWGVPIVEAKACGIPGLYQNYSAMEDHVQNGGGMPIKVERMYTESETMSKRSLPDIEDLAAKLKTLIKDKARLKKLSEEARAVAVEKHDWTITTKKLESIIDKMDLPDRSKTWDAPPNVKFVAPSRSPQGLSDPEFIYWCYINILGRKPEEKGFSDWMNSLKNGTPRDKIENFFRSEIDMSNAFEQKRWNTSMALRGIPVEQRKLAPINTNIIPGMLI